MSSQSQPSISEKEKKYLQRGKHNPNSLYFAHPDSVQEGFEYLFSAYPNLKSLGTKNFLKGNPIQMMHERGIPLRALGSMFKIMRKIQKGSNQSWKEIQPYLDNLKPSKFKPKPNLWHDINILIKKNWNNVEIGFTELPQQMIFKGKYRRTRRLLRCRKTPCP